MYVVETAGRTARFPEGSTVPIPPSIVTPDALEAVHVRVEVWPFSIADGEALSVTVGAGAAGTAGCSGSAWVAAVDPGAAFLAQPVPERSRTERIMAVAAAM